MLSFVHFVTLRVTRTTRQKTCLVAVGSVLRGLAVSAAARPTSSVPENANAAVTKTEQKPLKPSFEGKSKCDEEQRDAEDFERATHC